MTTIINTTQRLSDFGIKPSHQRVSIMKYMIETKSHPTADMVYNILSPKMPTLSKATVYNTLNLLSDAGAIKTLSIDPVEKRFDACIDPHAHFLCQCCKKVYDIEINTKIEKKLEGIATEHNVYTKEIYLTGVCKQCKTTKKEKQQKLK